MPSKRTNDSVDRILADLNQRQAADGVRASVTDHQVDEILRSVGISTTPLQNTPTQDSQIAFSDFGGPDDFEELMRTTTPAAPSAARMKAMRAGSITPPGRTTGSSPSPSTARTGFSSTAPTSTITSIASSSTAPTPP